MIRLTLFSVLLFANIAVSTAAAKEQPDVIMVIWDATRADHLSPYGYTRDTTPNLKKLAQSATVFEHAQSGAPWTVPSVASIFTGLFTHNHKVDYEPKDFTLSLSENVTTLAEALQANNYHTAIYTTQGIYYKQPGFLQGFDETALVTDRVLADRGLAYLKSHTDKPVFLVLYYINPHAPYEPNKAHNEWFQNDGPIVNLRGCPKNKTAADFPEGYIGHCDINSGKVTLSEEQWAQMVALYDGELQENDARLGKFLDDKAALNRNRDTLFVLTSDHGEAFNDHENAKVWHSIPHDTNQRVPLIIQYPGVFDGGRVSSVVRTIDIYPTILNITGSKAPHAVNGRNLAPLVNKKSPAPDRINIGTSHFTGAPIFLRTSQHKLIKYRKGPRPTEVYDLKNDPKEQHNLAIDHPELVIQLEKVLENKLNETRLEFSNTNQNSATQEELDRLRALGYVD